MGRPKGSRNKPGHAAGGYRPNSGRKSRHADGGGDGGDAALADAAGGGTELSLLQGENMADASAAAAAAASAAATAASVAAAVVEGAVVGRRTDSTEHDADVLANAILNDSGSSSDLHLPPMPDLPEEPIAATAAASGEGDVAGMFEGDQDISSSRGRKRARSSNDQDAPTPNQSQKRPKTADEQWTIMFNSLRDYAASHNGSTHVRLTPQTRSLYHWVHNQCTAYRNLVDNGGAGVSGGSSSKSTTSTTSSSMTIERVERLASIGLNLPQRTGNGQGANTTKWESKYQQLVSYKSQHGNCNVPYNYSEDAKFGKWCDRQRYWYRLLREGKKSQMTEERADRLVSIGLVGPDTLVPSAAAGDGDSNGGALATRTGTSGTTTSRRSNTVGLNRHTAKWEENFAKLLRYKSQHGDCMVKYNYEDTKLARWVDRQRYWYRLMKDGSKKKSQMTEGRAKRLADIGFVFYVRGGGGGDGGATGNAAASSDDVDGGSARRRESRWDARLAELLEYKARTGNLNVPHNYAENPALSNWVEKQKNELRLRAEGKESQMTPERERKLLAAGLTSRGRGAVWAQRVEALERYKSAHGHCRVPHSYPDDPQLAKWVSKQRTEMKARKEGRRSQLTDERIAQLDGLGFWDESYSAIASAAVARVAADADADIDNAADADVAAASEVEV